MPDQARVSPLVLLPDSIEHHARRALTEVLQSHAREINHGSFIVKSVSAAHVAAESLVLADASAGTVVTTLVPAAKMRDRVVNIKKTDASVNPVLVVGTGGETIDGTATVSVAARYDVLSVASDGATWWIMGAYNSGNKATS